MASDQPDTAALTPAPCPPCARGQHLPDCACPCHRQPSSAATGHLPEVLCNEDNVFFIVGGFSHDAARIALALHLRDCEGLSAEDAYVWANDVRIETRWMKWSDDDPEQMMPASEVERGSTLFTVMAEPVEV